MLKKRSDPDTEAPLQEDLIEERMQLMRDTRGACPSCQVQESFHDLDAYRKKIESQIGTGRQ